MSLFTQEPFLVQHGVQWARGAGEGPGGGRSPPRGPVRPGGVSHALVVFRHAGDDDAASHEKIVSSLLFHTVLELGLRG